MVFSIRRQTPCGVLESNQRTKIQIVVHVRFSFHFHFVSFHFIHCIPVTRFNFHSISIFISVSISISICLSFSFICFHLVLPIISFMSLSFFQLHSEPSSFRWSHTFHHSNTLQTEGEYDHEIEVTRPTDLIKFFLKS